MVNLGYNPNFFVRKREKQKSSKNFCAACNHVPGWGVKGVALPRTFLALLISFFLEVFIMMFGIRASLAATVGFLGLASAPAMALEVGENAPCVVLEQRLSDSSMAEKCIRDREPGQSHTLIEFFSTTCSACAINLPNVVSLGSELAQFATTRFVSIDRARDATLAYVSNTAAIQAFPVALDVERDAKAAYNVRATPTLFVLNSNNDVVYKHVGVLSAADQAAIKNIVKAGK
jgi:thioredoxin-related protein